MELLVGRRGNDVQNGNNILVTGGELGRRSDVAS